MAGCRPLLRTGYTIAGVATVLRIDLNSDVGESFGAWTLGDDAELIPLVTSANVACGFHAGDPRVIERTVGLAAASGVAVGAHPAYPDLAGFGRRALGMSAADLEAAVLYQVAAVAGFAHAAGVELRHVKAHGALYNVAARDRAVAGAIARGVRRFSGDLVLVGLAGSALLEAGHEEGLTVAAEAFADRAYEPDGSLRPRHLSGAVLHDPQQAAHQALGIVRDGGVRTSDGSWFPVRADTLCIHGDTPGAPIVARAVGDALRAAGVRVASMEARALHPGPTG